jgi:hypothetical protein
MKKAELEEAYQELQYRYNKLHSDTNIEIEKLKRENVDNIKKIQSDNEKKAYELWKKTNGQFMKRYIEELIIQEQLKFSFKTGYRGHFEMEIHMDGKFLTSIDGEICMKEDTLEW